MRIVLGERPRCSCASRTCSVGQHERALGSPSSEGKDGAPGAQLVCGGEDVLHLVDVTDGSAATLTRQDRIWHVQQAGPMHLWDAIENTWDAWAQAGHPGPDQFRMRIGQGKQTITYHGDPSDVAALTFALP
ncbi:hypothetical protein [Actinomadura sp. 6N118]|uniref:hypothetical protein n=1 Tax=Actinomadura sp. 6N118 TaxID=3375151 RepID=UPI0037A3CED9